MWGFALYVQNSFCAKPALRVVVRCVVDVMNKLLAIIVIVTGFDVVIISNVGVFVAIVIVDVLDVTVLIFVFPKLSSVTVL